MCGGCRRDVAGVTRQYPRRPLSGSPGPITTYKHRTRHSAGNGGRGHQNVIADLQFVRASLKDQDGSRKRPRGQKKRETNIIHAEGDEDVEAQHRSVHVFAAFSEGGRLTPIVADARVNKCDQNVLSSDSMV